MGAPIVDPDAKPVKVTHINNTRAVLQANLNPCQLGWETDYHCLGFNDEAGTYHSISIDDSLAHDHDDRYHTESEMGTLLAAKESVVNKGVANGYASLDSAGKVPVNQLPNSIMEYKGSWNASTNTPTLAAGVGNTGDVYRASVAGSQFGISFVAGDYCIYNGSTWEKSDATDAVTSVDGYQGAISLAGKYVSIAGTEEITGAKTFTQTTTFGSDIVSNNVNGLTINTNTIDGSDTKYVSLFGAGGNDVRAGGLVAYGNEHPTGHGDLRLYAGVGNGTTTGAVMVSPRAYFGTRPANDFWWDMAIGPRFTLYDQNKSAHIMNNIYNDGTTYRRRQAYGASWLQLSHYGGFEILGAATGAANSEITEWYRYLFGASGNVAIGKASLVGGNKLEVEGNTFVNGTTKTKKINYGDPETIYLTSNVFIDYSTKTGNFFRFTRDGTGAEYRVTFTNVPKGTEIFVLFGGTGNTILITYRYYSGTGYIGLHPGKCARLFCVGIDSANYPIFGLWSCIYTAAEDL